MSAKSKPPKSWQEKLADSKGLPKVEEITYKMSKRWGTSTVVIPAPEEVDEIMRKIPEGKLTTINEIRVALAQKHGATIGCPITTGIFAWVAAHAAAEAAAEGKQDIRAGCTLVNRGAPGTCVSIPSLFSKFCTCNGLRFILS